MAFTVIVLSTNRVAPIKILYILQCILCATVHSCTILLQLECNHIYVESRNLATPNATFTNPTVNHDLV